MIHTWLKGQGKILLDYQYTLKNNEGREGTTGPFQG
jgi:hypothetical protein